MTKSESLSTNELERLFKAATYRASQEALKRGHSIHIKRGRSILKIKPDGSEEKVGELEKAYTRPSKLQYKIS